MTRRFVLCAIFVLLAIMVNAQNKDTQKWVDVVKTEKLIVLKPNFTSIDLVFGNKSPKESKSIIACFGAAFTGERLEEFSHRNIAGPHAGGGKKYKGYSCKRNTGAFVYYNNKWVFCYGGWKNKNYGYLLTKASKNQGCGFEQEMMIYNNKCVKTVRPKDNTNVFRALCEKNGELLVIESRGMMRFGDFIDGLVKYGVKHALYLDMGTWWYGWYRPDSNTFVDMHMQIHNYHTNWLVFKR